VTAGIPPTIQHDDLHPWNVYVQEDRVRVLDWGDSSIAHPFWSLVVPFRFLEEQNGLTPDDPWFDRLSDAYLEPWGPGLREVLDLALRIGIFAHAVAWLRQRDHLGPADRIEFDAGYPVILRRALARVAA
jgi:aminoglycoside phosphotransferase (APT) family kinase protein